MIKNLKPGDSVYVVDRSDDKVEPSGIMYLATVAGHVIGTAWIYGVTDLRETLEIHAEETQENCDTDLMVYPICDCYETEEEVDEAVQKERESDE